MPSPGAPYDPADPDDSRSFISWVDPNELELTFAGGFAFVEREGVFAHSFRCMRCSLHFVVFSWSQTRHSHETVTCPECGTKERYIHRITQLSSSVDFRIDGAREPEIYDVWPFRLP